ncbi:hypothetical protein [Vibrio pectenicida]|uniref:Uncharacterized protein n=1 Tax=Vibrio pectenicida TaxID=62763 RepID=A0A3R9FM03_9VIBR|nr:hypothetical protein [Vibrio pectenicida]RSD29504.1 hypothetical protein EJA03_18345 [Vibrio pectenicida]
MEIEIYLPCDPEWFCDALLVLFAALFLMGLIGFAFIVRNEYLKIQRSSQVRKRRKTPLQQRKKQ